MRSALNKVFGYTDYRKYLEDFYEFKKSSGRGFSYRQFSKSCGFSSPNFLKLVISGERNLSLDSIEKILGFLSLPEQEDQYFRILVRLNQEANSEVKSIYYEDLKALTPHRQRRDLNTESVEYLSHWLYPVIREMASLPGFKDDPYWIARRLTGRTSPKEIRKALTFLLTHGFIEKNSDGYKVLDRVVLSSDEIKSLAVKRYHHNALDQAQEALEDLDLNEREFGALILILPEEALTELKGKLKAFRKELHDWAVSQSIEEKGQAQVVQYNFQMFTQSRKGRKS